MSEEQMTSMAGENLLEAAAPPQPDAPAIQGQEVRRWWTGLGGAQATSLILGVGGWILVLFIAFGSLRVSIREHTTEEGYLEVYGFGYAIVFFLIILVLNGLLGILLALIGMFTTKEPRGRWWSFYAILVHVSPWLLFTAWVWLSMRFGSS
ncbi:hypothetical protein QP500_09795 [Pauljensenia sp. UMB0018B]|uniref:Uncharacterized protein n=1 Tax=Schaalia odontolytica TaxID=1660 RepID=A0A2I1HXS5_9ACTO|nr:hypothetical protein [Schaalia odontolytica]MDK7340738.1 hypothetical protein [Pauljensenia sp. UMB0018B]PKY63682.1 hypothetical protein CYJ22_09630 [Schaalia odontolytica]